MKSDHISKKQTSEILTISPAQIPIAQLIRKIETAPQQLILFTRNEHLDQFNSKIWKVFLNKAVKNLTRKKLQMGILPIFKKNWWQANPKTPFIICKKEFAIYLLQISSAESTYDFTSILYFAKKFPKSLGELLCPISFEKKKMPTNFFNLQNRINWYFKIPLKERTVSKVPSFINEPAIYRLIFLSVTLLGLFSMLWMSTKAGISSDEFRYIEQSEKVYNYYTSFGEDKSATIRTGLDAQHYNAQSFDVFLYTLQESLGIENNFTIRHLFNAFFGWIAFLFTALIAIRLGGYRAGILAFYLLFISPRFLGHSFNNHRDIIIASVFVFTVYYMLPYFERIKNQDRKWIIYITLGLVGAFSLRFSSWIILFFYFSLFSVLAFFKTTQLKNIISNKTRKLALNMFIISSVIFLLSFNLGVLTWPFGLEAPIKNSLEVFNASSNLGVSINLLFEGELIKSNTIPWYYVVKFLGITTPVIIFIGFFLFLGSLKNNKNRNSRFELLLVFLSFFIPMAISIVYLKNDYGGWRHFLFAYPFLVVLSAIGIHTFIQSVSLQSKKLQPILLAILFIFTLHPSIFILKNHPYQYVYFNEIQGGVKNAHGFYSVDYGANSLKEGSEWIEKNILQNHTADKKITLVTNDTKAVNYYLKGNENKVDVRYSRYYAKNRVKWDYAIFYCDYIDPHQIQQKTWPPAGTIHTIEVDNQPIAAIIKRPSNDSYLGYEALNNGKTDQAITLFENYVQNIDPTSEEVFSYLASSYLSKKNYAKALACANQSMSLHPTNNVPAMNVQGRLQVINRNFKQAVDTFDEIIKNSPKYSDAYYYKAYALTQMKDVNKALKTLTTAININPKYKNAYMLLAEIYKKNGHQQKAKEVLKVMKKNIS